MSRRVSLKNLNGHQLAHKKFPKDIRFFNQSGHEVHYLIDHISCTDEGNDDFQPFVCTHLGVTKALHHNNDGTEMICINFDSTSPKARFNVSDSFREGKNINNRRKWQAPTTVTEAEVHENDYSEIESYSEISDHEVSDEDLALNQESEDSEKTKLISTPAICFVNEPNETMKLTTDPLDCYNILVSQENDSILNTVRSWI